MTYQEYLSTCRRYKAEQAALDKKYIDEYPHKDLFGKVVTVRYRFRGKIRTALAFFEGLEPFFRDMIPILKYLRKDGTASGKRLANIYSLKQIVDFKEENNEQH